MRKKWIAIYLFVIFVLLSETVGVMLSSDRDFWQSPFLSMLAFIFIIAAAIPVSQFLCRFFTEKTVYERDNNSRVRKTCFKYFWIGCFLCWIPVLLAYWPTLFTYDAYNQMQQNAVNWYSMQHPLIHTKMMGLFYWLGRDVFQSVNAGFAMYSLLQMGIVSGSIAYAIDYLYRKNVKLWICGLLLLWACFWPVHPILAISTTKDIIFSAMFLLVFILSIECLESGRKWSIRKQLLYFAALTVLMLFRKNGIHTILFFIAGMFCTFLIQRKKTDCTQLKKLMVLLLAGIVMYQCSSLSLRLILHAEKGSTIEALSVPIQQIARTYTEHKAEISESDRKLITLFIPEEALERYKESLSDPVKDEADRTVLDHNLREYISLYIRLGHAFPGSYTKAFLYSTMGYWYLDDVSHARIYGWGENKRQGGYLATNSLMIEGIDNVVHKSLLPAVENVYEKIATDNIHQRWLLISCLFAPAFYIWIIILGSILLIINKKTIIFPAMYLLCGYFFTLLLGPCCIMRYAYPLILCAPVVFIISFPKSSE